MSDEVLGILLPSQLKAMMAENVILIEEIAAKADISPELTHVILEGLVEADRMIRSLVPICPATGERVGEFDENEIPDMVHCPLCLDYHDLAEINVAIHYTPIPFDEEDMLDEDDDDLLVMSKVTNE